LLGTGVPWTERPEPRRTLDAPVPATAASAA
jgi:hypothetical protein